MLEFKASSFWEKGKEIHLRKVKSILKHWESLVSLTFFGQLYALAIPKCLSRAPSAKKAALFLLCRPQRGVSKQI